MSKYIHIFINFLSIIAIAGIANIASNIGILGGILAPVIFYINVFWLLKLYYKKSVDYNTVWLLILSTVSSILSFNMANILWDNADWNRPTTYWESFLGLFAMTYTVVFFGYALLSRILEKHSDEDRYKPNKIVVYLTFLLLNIIILASNVFANNNSFSIMKVTATSPWGILTFVIFILLIISELRLRGTKKLFWFYLFSLNLHIFTAYLAITDFAINSDNLFLKNIPAYLFTFNILLIFNTYFWLNRDKLK